MVAFYFTYKFGHKYWGGWVRLLAYTWQEAQKEYEVRFGRDYLNFYQEDLFQKSKYVKGEQLLL